MARYSAVTIAMVLACCGSRDATATKAASEQHAQRVSHCDEYPRALYEARQVAPMPGDEADVDGMTACGCRYTIHTSTALAAKVDAAFRQWTRDGCGPVNCDTPCSAQVMP
jgi:hypothetical protein